MPSIVHARRAGATRGMNRVRPLYYEIRTHGHNGERETVWPKKLKSN
jgi:hypothetical protein